MGINNYGYGFVSSAPMYSYSCTYPLPSGTGNINGNSASQQFLDLFHIATTSPCRGAGSALYASGTDLDGEPWANPPSMGCDEVVVSNLVGPLSVVLIASQTNLLVSPPNLFPLPRPGLFQGIITGRASRVAWSFGDGLTITNSGATRSYYWTNSGDYTVTFTAYNNDNPAGVSTNTLVHVLLPNVPQLQSAVLLTNGISISIPRTVQRELHHPIRHESRAAPDMADLADDSLQQQRHHPNQRSRMDEHGAVLPGAGGVKPWNKSISRAWQLKAPVPSSPRGTNQIRHGRLARGHRGGFQLRQRRARRAGHRRLLEVRSPKSEVRSLRTRVESRRRF